MIKIAPSLLAADFADMGKAVENIKLWGGDYVHFDVMDGNFVPTITFGPAMCKAIRKHTDLVIDVHLMVENPEHYIDDFAQAGADILSFHAEADRHIHRTLQKIHRAGMKAGVVLNPATSLSAVEYILNDCDIIVLMSVNPGAGGQKFIPSILSKTSKLKAMINEAGANCEIELDGGINIETAALAKKSGADVLVSGSSVFTCDNPKELITAMKA